MLCDLSVFRVFRFRGSYPNVIGHGICRNTSWTEHISHLEKERRTYWRESVSRLRVCLSFCFLVDVLISRIATPLSAAKEFKFTNNCWQYMKRFWRRNAESDEPRYLWVVTLMFCRHPRRLLIIKVFSSCCQFTRSASASSKIKPSL